MTTTVATVLIAPITSAAPFNDRYSHSRDIDHSHKTTFGSKRAAPLAPGQSFSIPSGSRSRARLRITARTCYSPPSIPAQGVT